MTHDLVRSIIGQTGNRVDRIVIADMRNEIYYATIYIDGGRYTIDSRPSDAIALAMGMNVADLREQQTFRVGAHDRARRAARFPIPRTRSD